MFLVRKGKPEKNQGLGRFGETGHPGDHAQSENLGRRAAGVYLAAWAYALKAPGGTPDKALEAFFVTAL